MDMTPRDKRMLQILGVVAALAVVYFLVTNVFGGGGGGEQAAPTGSSGPVVLPSGSPTLSPTPTPVETLPPVVLAGARDPFSIPPGLETASQAPSGTTGATGGTGATSTTTTTFPTTTTTFPTTTTTFSTSTTTTGTTTTTTTGTTTTTTTTGPGGGDDNTPPPNEITIGGHDLRLEKVVTKHHRVEIRVDHTLWTVEEGATFADNYKLVRIDGDCARFLYGDQSFNLCMS
jgi:hypothetical protein